MSSRSATPKKPKPRPAARYGIAEWFGDDPQDLSHTERVERAGLAADKATGVHACRFAAALDPGARCGKPGGVCSMRRFLRDGDAARPTDDSPVVFCPQRFLEDGAVLRWVGATMLGSERPICIREIPFLAKQAADGETEDKRAGRIDWVLVHPDAGPALRWCALESQSVYFSGRAMADDFSAWATCPDGSAPFPTAVRRPDYRSSGPKRLAPQLRVKVPELRAWGAKTAVVVDEYFFSQMRGVAELAAGDTADRLANAGVVWFVVGFDGARLQPRRAVFTRLDNAIDALNATRPVGKTAFEAEIADCIRSGRKTFRL